MSFLKLRFWQGSVWQPSLARMWPAGWARRRVVSIIGALGLALALGACSAVKIAYNQGPDLAYWYLDEYVDFTGAQSLQVKADLTRLQAWHRQTQLPGYVQLLQKVQEQARTDTTKAQVCTVFSDAKRQMMTLAGWAEGPMAGLAATISPTQLKHIERRFDKGNTQYREDFMDGTPDEVRKRRIKLATKRAESLYGSLDARQSALLAQMVDRSVFDARRIYAERLRRERDVLQTLREVAAVHAAGAQAAPGTATAASKAAIRSLVERMFASPDQTYRAYAEKLVDDGCAMFAELHNTTSAAQRSKAIETLGGYEQDFKILAGQAQG